MGKSDHLTLTFHYKCYWQPKNEKKEIKLYKKADFMKMREQLLQGDWKEGIIDKRTEEIWKRVTEKFNQVIDENVPTIKANRKKNKIPLAKAIRDKIKEKDKLLRKVYALKKQGKKGNMIRFGKNIVKYGIRFERCQNKLGKTMKII